MEQSFPSILILVFPVFFVSIFVGVIFLISQFGWARLASSYRNDSPFEGKHIGIITARINRVNYKNCLSLKCNEEGLYMRPILFFRLFHPPVLIPWKDIVDVKEKKILFFTTKKLTVGEPSVSSIEISRFTYSQLEPYYLNASANQKSRYN
ncbi:hypothetical protein [Xanthocytophaga agilis]|uniref:Uncharacterized protein n=1 Tax=Xanthocytophaga agilis TaxID=3048010 RepID=A0AAE3RB79_9BACT|nr:hypothetical protein [Xanthocytophaga agilis]MDJ1506675.1 hypothetical protein [Xanthocytophaga agilis]